MVLTENGENDDLHSTHNNMQGALLLKPWKRTKMTKMADVTQVNHRLPKALFSLGGSQNGGFQKGGFADVPWTPNAGTRVPETDWRKPKTGTRGYKNGTTLPKTSTRVQITLKLKWCLTGCP